MDVLVDGQIMLYGTVGETFFGDGFTARDVVNALAKVKGKDVSVRINSGGGIADEGTAIYNSLKNHDGKISVFIDGVAASAASLIAMAGETITMRLGSTMMIHDPMIFAMGNAEDLAKAIDALDTMGNSMAEVYAERTGRPVAEIRNEMRDEIWLTPDEAVNKGYADATDTTDAIEASAFDYRAYARAPDRIVALSDERHWSNRLRITAANKPTEPHMTVKNTPEVAPTAEAAAATAIKAETERAAEISKICADAKLPALATVLISEGKTVEEAKARLEAEGERATAIRKQVESARSVCPQIEASLADELIAAGTSADGASTILLQRIAAVAAAAPKTNGRHQAGVTGDQAATATVVDRVVGKINARLGK